MNTILLHNLIKRSLIKTSRVRPPRPLHRRAAPGAGPCTLVVRDHGRRLKTHLFTRYDSAHVVGCHLANNSITHSPCMRFLPQLLGNGWGLRVGVEMGTHWRPTVPNPHANPKVRCAVSEI